MTSPLDHQELRGRVCGACFLNAGKNSRKITSTILQDLRMYVWEGYSLVNNALPTVVCSSCQVKLRRCRGVRKHIFTNIYFLNSFCRIQNLLLWQTLTTGHWFLLLCVPDTLQTGVSASSARREGWLYVFSLRGLTTHQFQSKSALIAREYWHLESTMCVPGQTETTIFWILSGPSQPRVVDRLSLSHSKVCILF